MLRTIRVSQPTSIVRRCYATQVHTDPRKNPSRTNPRQRAPVQVSPQSSRTTPKLDLETPQTASSSVQQPSLNSTDATLPAFSGFVEANEKYVSGPFGDRGSLAISPLKKCIIITCMDARINPLASLGLKEGEAHIIRNAGGMVSDSLRSIIISQRMLGTREIAVFHHTGCGLLNLDANALRTQLKSTHHRTSSSSTSLPATPNPTFVPADLVHSHSNAGTCSFHHGQSRTLSTSPTSAAEAVDAIGPFHEFQDLEKSVRDDVQLLREHPLIVPDTTITGWVYEVETGKIRRIS